MTLLSMRSRQNVSIGHGTRRGFTLRELSIAMSVGSIVMMTAVGILHHAFDWSTTAMKRREDDQTCFRFAQQLRADLTDAIDATIPDAGDSDGQEDEQSPSGKTLQIQKQGNVVVSYQVNDQNVTRVASRDQQTLSQERYRWRIARTLVFKTVPSNQIGVDIKTDSIHSESEIPLWRRLRITIGLRLQHVRGELES